MTLSAPVALVLDASPLGLLTQRPGHAGGDACKSWYASLLHVGCRFFVPEIADYEVRRELLRRNNAAAVARLDGFSSAPGRYLPLTTESVRLAAHLWAQTRQAGRVTADPKALDGDVLIAAQARLLIPADFGLSGTLIATENLAHFTSLAPAAAWSDIQP